MGILNCEIEQRTFIKDRIEQNGNKFLLGNGYMGYRGTMEEFSKEQLAACNLLGVYDRVGDCWREPINAPNGLYTRIICNGIPLSVLDCELEEHTQSLDIGAAIHKRETAFKAPLGNVVKVRSERFLSLDNVHLICMKYSFKSAKLCRLVVETGIDGDVWDINGPHLKNFEAEIKDKVIVLNSRTQEFGLKVSVAEAIEIGFNAKEDNVIGEKSILRSITVDAMPDVEYSFYKYVSVFTGKDGAAEPDSSAVKSSLRALNEGYDKVLAVHKALWNKRWEVSDVQIIGDEEAQLALRYSIYHLLSIAPTHSDGASIPARGLSGQVYKGAIFWDTEMFMLPFFIYTNPEIARNLVKYRIHTLDGARRKAAEYGYRGAFYAWESQDTGDDACTLFNITDVFTGRPMRTYFRDKQVHISADVVYGIWQYYLMTGDESILLEGGAEVILECARFFYSYSYYKNEKKQFEIVDVTGPDEYHERVNNNAFTNMMVKFTLEAALQTIELLSGKHSELYSDLIAKLDFERELANLSEMLEKLYIPGPDEDTHVIEQFSGYHSLEDLSLKELKSRVLNPNEYLGGGNGLAATTKILKQADTVLMLNLFKRRYTHEIKKANWEYYEPRTEHGSSLSPCVYALLACDIGNPQWGYKYFMKTATIDLTGESKQYVGTLYIGGTHPAANGGAWMAAVLGFGGVDCDGETIIISPKLPEKWESLSFNLKVKGQQFRIIVSKNDVAVQSEKSNTEDSCFKISGLLYNCKAGDQIKVSYYRVD